MKQLFTFVAGFFTGIIITGILLMVIMPGMMITVHESRYDDVDLTCANLQRAIQESGWNSPQVRNMNKSVSEHGVDIGREIRIVELCNARYAKDILSTDPEVSTLMPCAWGVYEGDDGKVYISGMNMGLMGKLFGGNVARVIGGNVAKDESKMLEEVITDK
jgi:uncharacterized protein (DUF302 family)